MLIPRLMAGVAAGGSGIVTLTGALDIDGSDPGLDPYAAIEIAADGNVYKYEGSESSPTQTQLFSTDNWIRPAAKAGVQYEVRATENSTSGTATSPRYDGPNGLGNKSLNEWFTLDQDRRWAVNHNESNDTANWNITLDIRIGNTILATATYELSAIEITI